MTELFAARLERARGSSLRVVGVWIRGFFDTIEHSLATRTTEREQGGGWTMGIIGQDLRTSLRSLARSPVFATASVLTLALGIGASTATFSVVHSVLLEDLPFEDPERLVFVWPEVNANKTMALLADEQMPALQGVSGMSNWTLTLTGTGEPTEVSGLLVAPGYFEILGVAPQLGRTFPPDSDLPGRGEVVILSHDLWVSMFGSDPRVLGRVIDLGGGGYERREIIGVMPPGVDELWEDVDVWVPLEGEHSLGLAADNTWYVNERIARLAPGATLEQANEQVAAYARSVAAELPGHFEEESVTAATVQPLRHYLTRNVAASIWIALGAVSLVLLIGCFNVANLLLARGETRSRDFAVRAALGAGRPRIIMLLLSDALVIGVLGGVLGVLLASRLVNLVARLGPSDLPGIEGASLNGPVIMYALCMTAIAVLVAGLAPALRVGRTRATAGLSGSARSSSGRALGRVTPALVGTQVALAVMVAVGSGLMLRSLNGLLAVDPGMDGERVLVLKPNPPESRYADTESYRGYYTQVLERVGAVPGVEAVGAINLMPGRLNNWSFPTHPEGYLVPEGAPTPVANFRAVRSGYFETTAIPVLGGRSLSDGDRSDSEPVVVVNETFAETFWPGEDPLGKTLSIFSASGTRYRVVGLVGDTRQHGPRIETQPEMYFSDMQIPWDALSMWVVARVQSDEPMALALSVREAVWEIDPNVPINGTFHLADVLNETTATTRFLTWLLTAFGALALTLCAVGVFGVTAYVSNRRRAEFGVRLALGSSRANVVATGVTRSLGPIVAGLALGTLGAISTTGYLAASLYGVEPNDPVTFAAVVGIMALVGFGAAAVPAWRASRVDPVTVLGSE